MRYSIYLLPQHSHGEPSPPPVVHVSNDSNRHPLFGGSLIQDARAFVVRGAVCSHRKEGIGGSVAAQTTKNEKPITVQLIWTELSIWLLLLFLLARLLRLICGSLMRN